MAFYYLLWSIQRNISRMEIAILTFPSSYSENNGH